MVPRTGRECPHHLARANLAAAEGERILPCIAGEQAQQACLCHNRQTRGARRRNQTEFLTGPQPQWAGCFLLRSAESASGNRSRNQRAALTQEMRARAVDSCCNGLMPPPPEQQPAIEQAARGAGIKLSPNSRKQLAAAGLIQGGRRKLFKTNNHPPTGGLPWRPQLTRPAHPQHPGPEIRANRPGRPAPSSSALSHGRSRKL